MYSYLMTKKNEKILSLYFSLILTFLPVLTVAVGLSWPMEEQGWVGDLRPPWTSQ